MQNVKAARLNMEKEMIHMKLMLVYVKMGTLVMDFFVLRSPVIAQQSAVVMKILHIK